MGLIREILGLGPTVKSVAEVFTVNKTKQAEFQHDEHEAALAQFATEFGHDRVTWFDGFVDGLNRLPRPVLALGTVGLFVFAMVDPVNFSSRMVGLDTVPVELWWLLGAIVSFYFGARELHYVRDKSRQKRSLTKPLQFASLSSQDSNAALEDWRKQR
ncbi:MAG: holin family protein [Pseudomonadota bacterium]